MINADLGAVVEDIACVLKQRSQTFALAESCTGGLISAHVTAQPGSSHYYMGGVVSYANSVKQNLLGVPVTMLQALGAVSLPVAQGMAKGVRESLNADWGVSVTGIAGPSGGSTDKPVGTVCFSWVGPGFEKTHLVNFEATLKRREIQQAATVYCLTEFQKYLTS